MVYMCDPNHRGFASLSSPYELFGLRLSTELVSPRRNERKSKKKKIFVIKRFPGDPNSKIFAHFYSQWLGEPAILVISRPAVFSWLAGVGFVQVIQCWSNIGVLYFVV